MLSQVKQNADQIVAEAHEMQCGKGLQAIA
jgi:hypothetical protein